MNCRERFERTVLGENPDRVVFWGDGFWAETLEGFARDGLKSTDEFGWDFTEGEMFDSFPLNYSLLPPFEKKIIRETEDTVIFQDVSGIHQEKLKNHTGMPRFFKFPLESREDWPVLREKLEGRNPLRLPPDIAEIGKKLDANDRVPTSIGSSHYCGFFSLMRELSGDECYFLFFDDPDLVHEVMKFQAERIKYFIKEATKYAKIDKLFIWEDMCYKTGPLIGPELFREFLLEPYSDVIDTAKSNGIKIIDVDSDGNIEQLLPLWLEAGVNLLHPFEVTAGMDVNEIRKKFGMNFAMHGGVDKRALAEDRAAIDKELERIRPCIELGKYIPHVDHAVPENVSLDNYRYYQEKLFQLL